eukprot:3588537-Prymnesium_polylepis.1
MQGQARIREPSNGSYKHQRQWHNLLQLRLRRQLRHDASTHTLGSLWLLALERHGETGRDRQAARSHAQAGQRGRSQQRRAVQSRRARQREQHREQHRGAQHAVCAPSDGKSVLRLARRNPLH